jgi:transcriptional regulator with GAF, ATPase, and Fis domain
MALENGSRIDENEFFRTTTLRICGNLNIAEALHATRLHIGSVVPADAVFLEYYDAGLEAMRTIARADRDGGQHVDLVTPLPKSIREELVYTSPADVGRARPINRPALNQVSVAMLRFHGYDESAVSIMPMQLKSSEGLLGGIVFIAERPDRYNEEHARLVSLLADPFAIALANALTHREVLRLRDRLADDNRYLNRELLRLAGDEIVGADFGLRDVMKKVRQVAPTDSPVLLTGETGVGKDVIANAIHLGSPRRDGPFIAVNCGAIPDTLIDSELFGHEKGAFTGALARQRGRFERADGGTILLDEIGEMPLQAQVRLLRVIQHREIERLGGTERIPVDIRVIAATNQNLAALARQGRFREDLWFRLNVFPIDVPPLRERRSDIPALVRHFIDRKAAELNLGETPALAPGAIDALIRYAWPGNVRELENLVERAMIIHRGDLLRFDDLSSTQAEVSAGAPDELLRTSTLDEVVARHIRHALAMTGGKIHGPGGAGEILGVNPNTLRHRMKKLGIPFRKRRGDG